MIESLYTMDPARREELHAMYMRGGVPVADIEKIIDVGLHACSEAIEIMKLAIEQEGLGEGASEQALLLAAQLMQEHCQKFILLSVTHMAAMGGRILRSDQT